MSIIINPGSENKGGTIEQARINAQQWLGTMRDYQGIVDVEVDKGVEDGEGDFIFTFTHTITKKIATLHTHGFTDEEAEKFLFRPRVYWNGCSSSNPCVEDFLPEGWKFKVVVYQ